MKEKLFVILLILAAFAQAQTNSGDTIGREPASYVPKVYNEATVVPTDAAPQAGVHSNTLTGNWNGKRVQLSDSGVDLAVIYKYEAGQVLSGRQSRDTTALQNLDIKLLIDAEKRLGLSQTTFFFYGLGNWGADSGPTPSSVIGDSQGSSNIEAPVDNFKLYEFWAQKKFLNNRASILFGIHDLNSEFYVTDSSGIFLNSSFGLGKEFAQTGTGGPSIFPSATGSIRFKYESENEFYFQSAVFNAKSADPSDLKRSYWALTASDGFLLINEFALTGALPNISKLALGHWTYTRLADHRTETLTDNFGNTLPRPVNNSGVYFLFDNPLSEDLSMFIRYGVASPEANAVQSNSSFGLNWAPALVGEGDKLGLATTAIQPSDAAREPETVYELTYRIDVMPGFVIQPDLQYIINAGQVQGVSDSLAGKVRFEFGL